VEKSRVAHPAHEQAAVRWVELTVAHAMVRRGDVLDKARRRAITEELVGRWRGNRGPQWRPTIADLDALFDTTVRWVVENTGVTLFDAPGS